MLKELKVFSRILNLIIKQKNQTLLLQEVFDIIARDFDSDKVILYLYDTQTKNINIFESKGLNSKEEKRGSYQLGEGVVGTVAQNRKPLLIEDINDNKIFLNKTKTYDNKTQKRSFLCFPIISKTQQTLIGALSVDLLNKNIDDLNIHFEILQIITSFLAESIENIKQQQLQHKKMLLKQDSLNDELMYRYDINLILGGAIGANHHITNKILRNKEKVRLIISGKEGTGKSLFVRAIHLNKKYELPQLTNYSIPSESQNLDTDTLTQDIIINSLQNSNHTGLYISNLEILKKEQQKKFINTIIKKSPKLDLYFLYSNDEIQQNSNCQSILLNELKNRKTDITMLADFYLTELNKIHNKNIERISTPAINAMISYHWPGNLAELKNAINYAVNHCTDDVIHSYNLPASLQMNNNIDTINSTLGLRQLLDNYEKEILVDRLKQFSGHLKNTANSLETSSRVLHYRLKKLKINAKNYKINF